MKTTDEVGNAIDACAECNRSDAHGEWCEEHEREWREARKAETEDDWPEDVDQS